MSGFCLYHRFVFFSVIMDQISNRKAVSDVSYTIQVDSSLISSDKDTCMERRMQEDYFLVLMIQTS